MAQANSKSKLHSAPVGNKAANQPANYDGSALVGVSKRALLGSDAIDTDRQEIQSSLGERVSDPKDLSGVKNGKPIIIQVSDFVPLFDTEKLLPTKTYDSLALKETSKSLTAKVTLSTCNASVEAVNNITDRKEALLSQIDSGHFMDRLSNEIEAAKKIFNIKTFSLKFEDEIMSFSKYLSSKGHSPENYSSTKIWNQAALEFKHDVMYHDRSFLPASAADTNSSPFTLSGITLNDRHRRLCITPGRNNQTLLEIDKLGQITKKTATSRGTTGRSSTSDFSEMTAADDLTIQSLIKRFDELFSLTSSPGRYFPIGSTYLSGLSGGKDIALLLTLFARESNYSHFVNDSAGLLVTHGYSANKNDSNIKLWDHVVGKFTKDILNFNKSENNKWNLRNASYNSTIDADGRTINVLNFENNDLYSSLLLMDEKEKPATQDVFVPGSYEYIDKMFEVGENSNFNTGAFVGLLDYHKIVGECVSTINKTQYSQDDSDPSPFSPLKICGLIDGFHQISNVLSPVYEVYYSSFKNSSKLEIDYNKISNLSYNNTSIRELALIARYIVREGSQSSISKYLKAHLFSWCIKKCMEKLGFSKDQKSTQRATTGAGAVVTEEIDRFSSHQFRDYLWSELTKRIDLDPSTVTYDFRYASQRTKHDEAIRVSVAVSKKDETNRNSASSMDYVDVGFLRSTEGNSLLDSWVRLMSPYVSEAMTSTSKVTSHSGVDKVSMLMAYFELILRMTASMCPEKVQSTYRCSTKETRGPYSTKTLGFVLSKSNQSDITSIYARYSEGILSVVQRDVTEMLMSQEKSINSYLSLAKYYFDALANKTRKVADVLQRNEAKSHLSFLKSVYTADTEIDPASKSVLLKNSFSKGQLILRSYLMSEIKDRLSLDSETLSKVLDIPSFSGYSIDMQDFFPVEDIKMMSFSLLSSLFKSQQWDRLVGGNKKLITVGIPPGHMENFSTESDDVDSDADYEKKRSLFVVEVYKIDRMYPMVAYEPQRFLFSSKVFPTRIISNWPIDTLQSDTSRLINIPMKYHQEGVIHKTQGYDPSLPFYYSKLNLVNKLNLYRNHAMSLLIEEYMNWMADVQIDESRYYNYGKMTNSSPRDTQFINYSSYIKSSTPASSKSKAVLQNYKGEMIQIDSSLKSDDPFYQQTKMPDITASVKSYFSNHDTLFVDPLELTKRINYAKKFDRVVSLAFDPDDFVVSRTYLETIKGTHFEKVFGDLVKSKIVVEEKSGDKTIYRHRQISSNDAVFDEYFVVVKPYTTAVASKLISEFGPKYYIESGRL
jgi:hypothetical protein